MNLPHLKYIQQCDSDERSEDHPQGVAVVSLNSILYIHDDLDDFDPECCFSVKQLQDPTSLKKRELFVGDNTDGIIPESSFMEVKEHLDYAI